MTTKFDRLLKLHKATGNAIVNPPTCRMCGGKVYASRSQVLQGQTVASVFCSRSCANKWNNAQRRKVTVEQVRLRYAKEYAEKPWGAQSRAARAFNISRERVRQIVKGKP